MKRFLFLTMLLLLMAGNTLMAQKGPGGQPPKMTEDQLSHELASRIARCLQLDEEKTAKFIPIYVDYRSELKKVWDKYRPKPEKQGEAEKQKPRQLSNEELEKKNADRFARCRATIDVEETYYKRFLKVLNQCQYEKMLQLEKTHLKRMKEERMRRMQQHKPKPQSKCSPSPNGNEEANCEADLALNS